MSGSLQSNDKRPGEKGYGLKAWLKINTNSNKKVLRKESGQLQLKPGYLLRVAKQLGPTTAPRVFYFTIRIFEGGRGRGGWGFLVKLM